MKDTPTFQKSVKIVKTFEKKNSVMESIQSFWLFFAQGV